MDLVGQHWTNQVCVVLVTFNSAKVIRQAMRSLPFGVEVIVVDNASTDESLAIARAEGALGIRNRGNLGFGKASNLGAAKSDREFILFLNPDAMLQANALEQMVATAHRYPDAGAIGPRLIDASGRSVWRFASILHPASREATIPPAEPEFACCMSLLTGAALLCRRTAFEEAGGFDENIFLYHEDDDLSLRLTRAGWSLIYEPAAEVFHAFGQSSGQSEFMTRFKSEQHLLSRAYISRKYGLAFDPRHEMRKAIKRLLIALVTFNSRRRAAALGRFDALRRLYAGSRADETPGVPEAELASLAGPAPEFAVYGRSSHRFDRMSDM